ncbi:unnamed protein product, partial [Didymodactylos carnosus]
SSSTAQVQHMSASVNLTTPISPASAPVFLIVDSDYADVSQN